MTEFLLNDHSIKTDLHPGTTVLDFIRYQKHLPGTKIGCREGDCGACSVLVGALKNSEVHYESMCSCLMALGNAQGKHIVTVEGINLERLSPVQQAMADNNGTQCGFCTVGFVISLTAFVLQGDWNNEEAIKAIDGNICRCTGYKSIERAAQALVSKLDYKTQNERLDWLVEHRYIPAYFLKIKDRLAQISARTTEKTNGAESFKLGGGTDLFVQKPETLRKSTINFLFDNPELQGIEEQNGKIIIGAQTTVTEMEQSPVLQNIFPDLKKYVKLIASTPIRNMATVAGNFTNASPIGDLTIFFLALDAELVLKNNSQRRILKLKDFYQGYKVLAKKPDEIIEKICFDVPKPGTVFNFEKVCKRTHLDIASVNSACLIEYNAEKVITKIHLSAGGEGPTPKYLTNTVGFLLNKKPDFSIIEKAIEIIQDEISPISDARGSADYKRLLLRQLFLAHIMKCFPEVLTPQKIAAL